MKENKKENKPDNILYKYCSEEWHPLIENNLKVKSYARGEYAFVEGEVVKKMKFIKSGKVKVISNEKGQEKIVRLAGEGDILGHRGLGSVLVYPVSAIALTDLEVYYTDIDLFLKLVKANPNLSFWLINFFADELRKSENQSKMLTQFTAKQRIASELLHIAENFGMEENGSKLLAFTPSRKDLSSLAGTTYETVIRTLAELEKDHAIKLHGKSIALINTGILNKFIA